MDNPDQLNKAPTRLAPNAFPSPQPPRAGKKQAKPAGAHPFDLIRDERVEPKFAAYPLHIRPKMEFLRTLILGTAANIPAVTKLEETLKWGEPSYLTKKGSTIRIDWKTKSPDQYAVYFKCTSKLVDTFREVYGDTFNYENNRAIIFGLEDTVPEQALKSCIAAALTYHTVKNEPLLGIEND